MVRAIDELPGQPVEPSYPARVIVSEPTVSVPSSGVGALGVAARRSGDHRVGDRPRQRERRRVAQWLPVARLEQRPGPRCWRACQSPKRSSLARASADDLAAGSRLTSTSPARNYAGHPGGSTAPEGVRSPDVDAPIVDTGGMVRNAFTTAGAMTRTV
jgi:hypothetical protein